MKYIFFIFSILLSPIVFSQNLIMNPSFEEYWQCPTFLGQIDRCKYLSSPDRGSPDYYNVCGTAPHASVPNAYYGHQEPKNGNAYVGLFHSFVNEYAKEYIQLSFSEELKPLKTYHFSIFVSVADITGWSSDFFHFKFSDTLMVYNNAYLYNFISPDIIVENLDLTDPTEWVEVSFDYVAHGGEKYIIIGNFNLNLGTDAFLAFPSENNSNEFAYFYLDDASIIELNPTITTYPATCNENGNAIITNYTSSNTYTFSPPGPTVDNNGVISGMTAETSYTVVAKDSSYNSYPSDTFSIEPQLPAPNPPTITSPQTFCENSTASYLQPFSADYQWYSSNNSPVHENDTLLSGTYYVSQTVDGCESERAEVVVQINPTPNVIVSPNQAICKGASISLTASGAEAYSWSPGNVSGNTISVSPTVTTTYTVTGITAEGCSDSASVTISILPTPTAAFSASDLTGAPPLQIDFSNSSSNADGFSWWVNYEFQSDDADFNYVFSDEGEYIVTLIAENEFCSDSVSKIIHVSLSFLGQIPNVFSPNSDGVNDVWEIEGAVKSVVILNRWGNEVFSANESFNGWNGKDKSGNDCTDGVYFYRVENSNGDYFVGFVSLVR